MKKISKNQVITKFFARKEMANLQCLNVKMPGAIRAQI